MALSVQSLMIKAFIKMYQPPESNALTQEFRRERSIRRTIKVLEAKRQSIREDLQRLRTHLHFLLPTAQMNNHNCDGDPDILVEALGRIDDDAFVQMILQVLQEPR